MEPKNTVARDGWNAATWQLYSHAGTHMDAQVHFAAGPETIDTKPLSQCMGPAWVVNLTPTAPRTLLTVAHLGGVASRFIDGESLLLRTDWHRHVADPSTYRDGLPRISEELAAWCVAHRVKILGVEPPSVADVNRLPEVTRIHHILLGGGVTITYLDQAGDAASSFQLIADQKQMTVTPKGTGHWQTAELVLPEGPLSAEPNGAHLKIVAGSTPVCLHMLEVTRF